MYQPSIISSMPRPSWTDTARAYQMLTQSDNLQLSYSSEWWPRKC